MQCKHAYEEKCPETKHGQNVRSIDGTYSPSRQNINMNKPRRFSSYTADSTGISESKIQRRARLAEALGAACLPDLWVTSEHSKNIQKFVTSGLQ